MKELFGQSDSDYLELIEILSISILDLKEKEQVFRRGKNAFLNMLEDVNEAYKELESLFIGLVRSMVNALDAKSNWTRGHSERVAEYAEKIGQKIGLEEEDVKRIQLAGLLHDIGKIGTYDYLLDKPEKLTEEEFIIIKEHPAMGARILGGVKQLHDIIPLIKYHHERIDGKGYPEGIRGDEIPFGARILHVADSFDSMRTDRPYRSAPGFDYALSEFRKYRGIQFDVQVVDAFLEVLTENGKKS